MADIDALSIRIEADAKNATRNVNRLANALTKLSDALNKIDPSKLNSAAMAANTMSNAVAGMKSSGKTINSVATAMTKIGEQGANIAQASNAAKNMSDSVGGLAKTSENAGNSAKKAAEGTKELGNSTTRANQVVKALSAGFKGFSNTLKSVGTWFKKTASSAFKAATHIKLFGKSAKGSSKSASSLVKEITRIGKMLKLMLTRMVLRQVISGIGDGFKNLAQYSKQFDATLSMLWNDFRQLGNSIAAAASPLLNVFAPAIHAIIQLVIQAVNAINQLLSALTGLTSFVRAKKLTDSYAGSLKKAGGAAKELKKTVLGFDELNQLQDNKNSGGGGTSPANMFEEAPISDKWKDWAKKIKDMWKKGDFTDLGKAIGEWLLNALNKIPWSKIYRTAAKIGKSLATLINGFVEVPTLGYTIGKSLAKAVNTAFYFLDDYVRNLHWKSIGQFIGETLNGFFENIKWNKIYDTVYYGVRGIASAIQEAIDTFHWDNISKTLINGLDVISMGIKEFFEGIDWLDLGQKMGDQLAKTIKGTPWKQVGEAIGSAIQAAIDWAYGLVETFDVNDAVSAIENFLKGICERVNTEEAGKALGTALHKLIETVKKFWQNEENRAMIKDEILGFFRGIANSMTSEDFDFLATSAMAAALLVALKNLLTANSATVTITVTVAYLGFKLGSWLGKIITGDKAYDEYTIPVILEYTFSGLETWNDVTDRLEEFANAWGDLKREAGLFVKFIAGLVDPLGTVATLLLQIFNTKIDWQSIGTDKPFFVPIKNEDLEGIERVNSLVKEAKQGFAELTNESTRSNSAIKNANESTASSFGKVYNGLKTTTDSADKASTSFGKVYGELNSTKDSIDKASHSFGTLYEQLGKSSSSFETLNKGVKFVDSNFKTATDNMSKNSKVVTINIPNEMANAGVSMEGTLRTLSQNVDTETKKGFDAAGKNSEVFTKDMPKSVTDAQGNMSKSVETLNGDFTTNFDSIKTTVSDSTSDINRSLDTVKDGMSEDKWTFRGVWEGLTKTFEKAKEGIKGVWNSIADKLNGNHQIFGSSINIDLPRFANGGFPENGLFMANSTEMVGKFSNGKNAVANNEQITEGIARAVFNAMTTAQSNSGGQYINNTIMVDGDVIARAVTKGQERLNRRYSPTMA